MLLNGNEIPTEARVLITDRSGQTGAVRYRYTGPVCPETGRYRWNSNLNSNFAVQPVRTGIPAGLAGIPVIWEYRCTGRLDRYNGQTGRYTGDLKKFSDGYKIDPRCEIKGNFGMSYANININDHTKATIYNYAYKYNSNKRAYKYGVIHLYTWNKSST